VAVKRVIRRSFADRVVEGESRIAADPRGAVSTARWAWEWTKSILVAFALFLVIRTFLVEAFRIPTGSMENTLLIGDFLLVNKAVFGSRIPFTQLRLPGFDQPDHGDVIVFAPPHDPGRNYVKRLVARPGDIVEMRDKQLYLNGAPLAEPFVRHSDPGDTYAPQMAWQCSHAAAPRASPCRPMRDNWGPIVVPDGRFLVLGDNRDDSEDSRYWGFVDREAIRGRPLLIYYSFDAASTRPLPWLTRIRWGRIGETVH
jgi:signal peptidase I